MIGKRVHKKRKDFFGRKSLSKHGNFSNYHLSKDYEEGKDDLSGQTCRIWNKE